jgi:mono/diheme cytochrome c family protein
MLKPFLVLSALVLFEIAAPTPTPILAAGLTPQDAAPAASAPASTNPVKPTAASQEKAKKIYAVDCALCHGDKGDGKTDLAKDMQLNLADWTDPKSLSAKSDQELFNAIRNGKGEKMPAEDVSRAKNDEVWNLVIFLRNMSKGQPSAPPAAPAAAPAAATN